MQQIEINPLKALKPYVENTIPTKEGMPTVFNVETVLACNLSCPECVIGTDTIDNRTKKVMRLDEFKVISDKIKPYAKMVYLHKWGEPLMNKNIFKMIEIASEYAHVHISTHGTLLDKEKCEKLILSGVGTLIVSIDGVTKEVYDQYRIGGDVDKVMKNIKMLSEFNKIYGNRVTILPQFIVFKHNHHEIQAFESFCSSLGLKAILKKPYIRFGEVVHESDDKKYQREKFKNKVDHVDAISNCPHATARMVVAANGKILLCTQDYDGDYNLGNLLDDNSTVESLWNNNNYLKIRNSIANKNPPKLCTDRCIIYNRGYL